MKIYFPTLSKKQQNLQKSGFALISTIIVMSLLMLIALAMLSVSSLESRTSGINKPMLQAQANARLALLLAMEELQGAAGPDQRITATASIKDTNTAQPHLLGVWKSFKQPNSSTDPITYDAQKNSDFVQWLSSTTTDNKIDQTYPTQEPADAVIMVGDGTLPIPDGSDPTSEYVRASLIDVVGTTGLSSGKYAWHVFDESQKANVTLPNPEMVTDAERVASLGSNGMPGFRVLASSNTFYTPLADITNAEQSKIFSLISSGLVGATTRFDPKEASAFRFLTSDSKSLLVDVANGGYQKDLSLLFENASLPSEYANRYIYSDSDTPIAPTPTRFNGAEPIPSPDPKWSLLHSHYRLFDKVTASSGALGIDSSDVKRDNTTEYFEEQQVLPVISNAQFIFSMAPQKHTLSDPYVGFLGLWVDLVVTVWNPYDVELRFDAMDLEFYRFPLELEFFREDETGINSASSGNPVHIAYMFNRGNNPTGVENIQDKLPYRARITGPNTASGVNDIILKPGEYKVFGAPQGTTFNHRNWNYTRGLVLEEGFNPKSGGIFERFISTDENYQAQCPWPFTSKRQQIQVKIGDVYSVEVGPAKVDRTQSLWPETNNKEVVSYLKIFKGDGNSDPSLDNSAVSDIDAYEIELNKTRKQIGAIEIDIPDANEMEKKLPSFGQNDMSRLTVTDSNNLPQGDATEKVPFLIASLRLKTEQDSSLLEGAPNSSVWLHNGVTNPYFSTGLDSDQDENEKSHQYELTWEPMNSWNQIPTVEVDGQNRGYGAAGVSSGSGVNFAPFAQIPLIPTNSLAQFSHAPLNSGGQAPLTSQIVSNSFSSPLIPLEKKTNPGSIGTHIDHSYMANNTLFDGYFLSTAATESGPIYAGSGRDLDTVISDFFQGSKKLANANFLPKSNEAPTIAATDYATFAQHIYNKGAFNVNSTSVEAWAMFLSSGTNESLPILDMLTASSTLASAADSSDLAVSRFSPLIGEAITGDVDDQTRWAGHRRLDPAQIMTLAENVVAEVKKRGPFQSVSEFVNRQLVSAADTADSGSLQTAIDNSSINTDFGLPAAKNNTELNSGNSTASTSDGAVTQITQADLLRRLAPSLTVRGDTFRIRTYGEATVGGVTVKVWCEAVVQREHDFLDKSQESTTENTSLNTTNQKYGRRFEIISFRWLPEDEV